VPKAKTITVTHRAMLQRLNKRLSKEGRMITTVRSLDGVKTPAGSFILVDVEKGALLDTNPNLEKLARESGALKPWEEVQR
jgi:hypothetical protein